MAETETAAKRTREGPKGPVKPEPATVEAEPESEARARALVGLLQAETAAAAAPPEDSNGNGHAAGLLDGLQRSARNGNGNGHGDRAVQPTDLHTLQRLAGNAAVTSLMAPRSNGSAAQPPVQRAASDQTPPERKELVAPPERGKSSASAERKAAKKEVLEAVRGWFAASPDAAAADRETTAEEGVAGTSPELADGTAGGPAQVAEAGGASAASTVAGATETAGPGGEAQAGTEGGQQSEGSSPGTDETSGGGPADVTEQLGRQPAIAGGGPADGGASAGGGTEPADNEPRPTPREAGRATTIAEPPRPTTQLHPGGRGPGVPVAGGPAPGTGAGSTQARQAGASQAGRASAPRAAPTPATRARPGGARIAPATARAGSVSAVPGPTVVAAAGPAALDAEAGSAPPTATPATQDPSPALASAAPPAATAPAATPPPAQPPQGPESPPTAARTQPGSGSGAEPAPIAAPPPAARSTRAVDAASQAASERVAERGRRAADEDEALESETAEGIERTDEAGPATRIAPKSGGGGGGGGGGGKAALATWQGAAGGAVGGVEPPDMSATKATKDAVAKGAEAVTAKRKAQKPDFKAEAEKVKPPEPASPPREKMVDFAAPRGAITSIRRVGATRLRNRTLKAAGSPPELPAYVRAEHYVPPKLTAELAETEKLAAETTGKEELELDKKASELRAKIQGLKEAEGVAPGGDEISISGEEAASTEPTESKDDRAVVAAALSELAGEQEDIVGRVVKGALKKVDPRPKSDKAKTAIDAHRGSIASELTTELKGIASAAGIVDKDLDAKITAGKAKATVEGDKAKQDTDTAAKEGKEELKEQGKTETSAQKRAASAVKEDAQAKVQAVEGGPEPEHIEAKVAEYLGKTITTGNKAKGAIATAVKKMTTKVEDKGKTKGRYFSETGIKRSDAVRRYWRQELKDDEDPLAAQKKGEEEAVETMAWLRKGKKGTDSEVGLIKNEIAAEHKSLDAAVDSTVTLARDTIRDWGAEQQGEPRKWWQKLLDDFMDWSDEVGTKADGWAEQQNAETRDTVITDSKAIDAILKAKKDEIDKVKDEQLEGMDSKRRAIIEQYLARGGSNSIQLVMLLTKHDITQRRTDQAVSDVDEEIMSEWFWTDVDDICRSRNPAWPGADSLASKILGGVGTNKPNREKIFEGLAGARTALERKALEGAFKAKAPDGSETSLDQVLEDKLVGDDEDRAKALREGKTDVADAAAIEAALSLRSGNIAPDTKSITKVLRGKSDAEIDAIKRAYKEKTGNDLDEVLADTWFYDAEESDMVVALAQGDTELADAAEVHDALKNLGTDEGQYGQVFDNLRSEIQAQALKEGMSPAEVEYEIKRRTDAIAAAYESKYGTSLQTAVEAEFGGTEQKLAEAYLTSDADQIDATKALDERYSLNSDDDALETTVRNQKERAKAYYKQHYTAMQSQLRLRLDAGVISQDEYLEQMQKVRQDRKANEKKLIDEMTVENTKSLRETYGDVSGGRNLDVDIKAVTQGASDDELTALLASDGVLSPADEIYYATHGVGTDTPMLKEQLYGKTPTQIRNMSLEYDRKHGEGSFYRDIVMDLHWGHGGREDQQVLLLLDHDTSTPEGKLAYLKAASELERDGFLYDDEDDPVGMDESIRALEEQLEEYNRIKNDPNASEAQKAVAKDLLDMRLSGSEGSLKEFGDLKDAEIDEWVDTIKHGLVAVNPAFTFLLLDDSFIGSPIRLALGGATADASQLAVEWLISAVDMALGVATVVTGGAAAPATVALGTLIKQGLYKEVAKRVIAELGQQALEAMVMAAMELALTEKAWESNDSLGVFVDQAINDYVVGLIVGGAIDVGTGALSKSTRIDADGRIVADDGGAKADGDGGRVDGEDARTDIGDELPDIDDTGTPRSDEGSGGSGRAGDADGGTTKADDSGSGRAGDADGGTTKAGDSGSGRAGDAELAAKAGMDLKTVGFLKRFSDALGLRLQFRPTTAAAPGQIAGGAKAKVEIAKMKTAKSPDRLLTDALDLDGADFGKVVLFEPHHPMFRPEGDPRRTAFDALDADGKQAVHNRYEQRLQEWDNLNPDKNPYFKEGSGLDGGPALRMDGPFVQVQGIEGDYSFMTGDHDLFDVAWADRRPMTKDDYDAIIASLRHAGVNVEHGAHITWPRDRPKDFDPDLPPDGVGPEKAMENRKAYEKGLADHSSGGSEPLVEISPDGVHETTGDLFMPTWDSEGTVTPGFTAPDSAASGAGKTEGDSGASGAGKTEGDSGASGAGKTEGDSGASSGTKTADAAGDGEVDTSAGDKSPEELQEELDAGTTPHPADEGEIERSVPADVF